MTILAKPIVANQFWILCQDEEKIGNIEATNEGFQVKINNQVQHFKTMRMVRNKINISFEPITKKSCTKRNFSLWI